MKVVLHQISKDCLNICLLFMTTKCVVVMIIKSSVTKKSQKELTLVAPQDPGKRERCPLAQLHILVRTLSGQPDRNVFDKDK